MGGASPSTTSSNTNQNSVANSLATSLNQTGSQVWNTAFGKPNTSSLINSGQATTASPTAVGAAPPSAGSSNSGQTTSALSSSQNALAQALQQVKPGMGGLL